MKLPIEKNPMRQFGAIIITATITVMGIVGFKVLAAHDNSEVATQTTQTSSQVVKVETVQQVATIQRELDSLDVDSLDADLDASFNF